ncbi:hypothetical protein Barb7_00894 [Bacteroidales bacterium Barb7]|nr:hypothetical protein Barb7_00894 [Bacteroidales bacterium Barb7]
MQYIILSSFQDTPNGVVLINPTFRYAACGAEISCPLSGLLCRIGTIVLKKLRGYKSGI